MTADAASCAMLAEMSACAYRLGMALGREAERVEAWERKLELINLFDRCFFSVRMATALQLRLRRAPAAALPREEATHAAEAPERGDPPESEPLEREPLEHEPPEHERLERERLDADREREGVSLPILLKTLEGVAADAAALPGPHPAELPGLRELLARVIRDPAPAVRPPAGGLRARLAGSATAAVATVPQLSAISVVRPPRRAATGPPRR